jgi:Zn-dependent protease with chaperone function
MVFHSAFFFLFSILAWLFGVLFLDEDKHHTKRILFFAFLIASLFALCAAKSMLEVSLLP